MNDRRSQEHRDRLEILGKITDPGRGDPVSVRAESLQREAVAWLSLLSSGTATVADGEALKRWCGEHPSHAEAYARAACVWDMLRPVAAKASDPALALRVAVGMPRRHMGRRAFLGGAIAASAACAAYAVAHAPLGLWPSLAELGADVRTATGEQRRLEIAQGIAVDLNTRSSLALRPASGAENYVELISGEAVVAAGSKSPEGCVVIAGAGRILARDARVDIRRDGHQVCVVCIEGRIQVEHQSQAMSLAARERVVYDGRGMGGSDTIDPTIVTAWQQGRLVFRRELLSRVIDEVNRYRAGHIVLLDRSLGQRQIDASFQLDHLENVVTYLQQAFNARIRTLPGGVVLVG